MDTSFRHGLTAIGASVRRVGNDPIAAVAWIAALVIAVALSPIWGAFALIGWLSARGRMREEGLAGIGEALAPAPARAQFANGVWRGIWKTQSLGVALLIVQVPAAVLALAPAGVAYLLFTPASNAFPAPLGYLVAYAVPALAALACTTILLAAELLTLRILALSGPDYSLGLVFRAAGAAWHHTLKSSRALVMMSVAFIAISICAGLVVGVSFEIARALELGEGVLVVLTWTGALCAVAYVAIIMEMLAGWVDALPVEAIPPNASYFSFSRWLLEWLKSAATWIAARGVVTIGLVAALIGGLGASLLAAFGTVEGTSSWVGLGWFAVTAAALVILHRRTV